MTSTDITLVELKNMSDDDVRNLNKVYAKKLLKKFAISTAVTVVVVVAFNIAMNKLADKIDEKYPNPDEVV